MKHELAKLAARGAVIYRYLSSECWPTSLQAFSITLHQLNYKTLLVVSLVKPEEMLLSVGLILAFADTELLIFSTN